MWRLFKSRKKGKEELGVKEEWRGGGGNIFFSFLFRIQKKKQDQKYKLFFQSVSGEKNRRESSSDTSHYSRLLRKCNLNFENPLPHSHPWGHLGKGPPLGRGQNCPQTAAENSHLLYKGSSGQFTDGYKAQRHISIESVGYSGLEWYWIMLDQNNAYLMSGKVIHTLNSKLNFYWSVHVFCLHELPLCCCQLTHVWQNTTALFTVCKNILKAV